MAISETRILLVIIRYNGLCRLVLIRCHFLLPMCVQEMEAKKREKEAALARNRRTRKHRRRLLAKCNYKGQPNLGSRVQLLLEKIVAQSDASQNTAHRQ